VARIPASTRMALQMSAGLGAAFALGPWLYPGHWSWTVLTAYIVASGNRGRGDVLYKSGLRVLGALAGTVLATLLASTFGPGDRWAVVAIFAVVGVGTWLRPLSYAYWAGCVTAALAFLYGYFGETGTSLLRTRLEGILLGAAVAVAAAWLVLPVRTADVLRRRVADVLAALTDYLTAARRRDPARLTAQQARFDHALARLDELAAPLAVRRRLSRRGRGGHPMDAIIALRACRPPLQALTRRAVADPALLSRAEVRRDLATVQDTIITIRRSASRAPSTSPGRLHLVRPRRRDMPRGQGRRPGAHRAIAGLPQALGQLVQAMEP
jgi:uncharacterized membrane protein YccC